MYIIRSPRGRGGNIKPERTGATLTAAEKERLDVFRREIINIAFKASADIFTETRKAMRKAGINPDFEEPVLFEDKEKASKNVIRMQQRTVER